MSREPVRKLSAIVSADIVGYSRMMAEDEMAALTALRSFREGIFEPQVHAHRGEIIKRMGDGWLLEFSSALDAAKCATELLLQLQKGGPIQLRVGVHVGDIVHESEDIYGDGVNVACRLQELAAPGAVLMSAEVNKIVSGSLNTEFQDVGAHGLKNIPGKTRIFAWSPQPHTGQPLIATAQTEPRLTGAPIVLVKQISTSEEAGEAHELAQEFHDELVIALSRHTGIRVIESESSPHTPDYILGGRCRVSGGQARFSLTISDGASGVKMWAEKFSGEVSDVDEFIDNLATRVDGILRVQVNAFAGARLAAKPDDELSFPDLLTKAAHLYYNFDETSTKLARASMEVALKLKPDDPMALAMLAHANCHSFLFAIENKIDANRDDALALANRAIELGPEIDFAFRTRAVLSLWLFHDNEAAIADARRALQINPSYHLATQTLASAEIMSGEIEAGLEHARKLLAMIPNDPQLPYYLSLIALGELLRGNEKEAFENAREAHERRPSSQWIGMIYAAAAAHRQEITGTDSFKDMLTRLEIDTGKLLNLPLSRPEHAELLRARLAASGAMGKTERAKV